MTRLLKSRLNCLHGKEFACCEYVRRKAQGICVNFLRKMMAECGDETCLGIAVYFYDPPFLDMAAHLGFKVMWIEMEHSFMTFSEVADLCRMARGRGMLTMIRIANASRENVLKAAECGPDIIDVPMINTAEQAMQLVKFARFPPVGERGFFSVSPSLQYGLVENVAAAQRKLNDDLCLMIQVETAEAVENIEELCAVPEVEIFIGPADLSASLGVPGEYSHPKVKEAARRVIAAAHKANKMVAVGSAPGEFEFYAREGVDILFCGNDLACMRMGIQAMLQQGRAAVGGARTSKGELVSWKAAR